MTETTIPAQPDATEIRVLGCLIEKERATPEQYPLSLNALRLACNQATNRHPVVDFDEAEVRRALGLLGRRGWIRSASGHGSRTLKYRHLAAAGLGLSDPQLAVMAVLMLRGPQTPGEIKQRTERLFGFESLEAVTLTLQELVERGLVEAGGRRPGQKEERYTQVIGAAGPEGTPAAPPPAPGGDSLSERVAKLEEAVMALRSEVEQLRTPR